MILIILVGGTSAPTSHSPQDSLPYYLRINILSSLFFTLQTNIFMSIIKQYNRNNLLQLWCVNNWWSMSIYETQNIHMKFYFTNENATMSYMLSLVLMGKDRKMGIRTGNGPWIFYQGIFFLFAFLIGDKHIGIWEGLKLKYLIFNYIYGTKVSIDGRNISIYIQ